MDKTLKAFGEDLTKKQRKSLEAFSKLPLASLIFTKLDESCTYGTLFNQITQIEKPLAYLTTGQKVPEDIEVATQERIVSLLLDEKVEFSE